MIAQKSASVKSTVNAIDASLENVIAGLDNGTVKVRVGESDTVM